MIGAMQATWISVGIRIDKRLRARWSDAMTPRDAKEIDLLSVINFGCWGALWVREEILDRNESIFVSSGPLVLDSGRVSPVGREYEPDWSKSAVSSPEKTALNRFGLGSSCWWRRPAEVKVKDLRLWVASGGILRSKERLAQREPRLHNSQIHRHYMSNFLLLL